MERKHRGRVTPAPNSEPVWLPDKPKKLVFGQHIRCWRCKGKGKKGGNLCGVCGGYGVIVESHRGDDHEGNVAE